MKKILCALSALCLTFCLSTCSYARNIPPDYIEMMVDAAVAGDIEAGHQAQQQLDSLIEQGLVQETGINFDDLFLLAKLIHSQAGSWWLSDEFRLCIGEVVLNRVASPEFPDTIEEVIYQPGQYQGVNSDYFQNELLPSKECTQAALRLLQGERMLEPQVVFQTTAKQDSVFSTYCDSRLGYTYFCSSPNLELYPESEKADTETQSEQIPDQDRQPHVAENVEQLSNLSAKLNHYR